MPTVTTSSATIRVHAVIDGLYAGGAEALLAEFARAAPAAAIVLTVTSLHLLKGAPVADRLSALGVEPYSMSMPNRLTPKLFRDLRHRLAAVPADIVHTHLGAADLMGLTAARTLRMPAVSTIHAMDWSATGRERVKMHMSAWARRHSAQVIAVSESARENYLAQGWDRPEHLTVVRNGISLRPAPGSGASIRRDLGLSPDEPVIGMLTSLRAGKGHEVAAGALARIQETRPDARLVIVGEGLAEPEIARSMAPLGDAALMVGHREDVMEMLDAFDVLVHPSHAEALPTVLMEAMAAGTPVVATAVGGVPEVVEHGGDGTLIPAPPRAEALARAVLSLLDDPDRAKALAAQAMKTVETRFGAERWMHETRAVYERAISGAG